MNLLAQILLYGIPVLFAVALHEVAHGEVARLLGDSTAQDQGRLSLNPLRHIDPVGTVLVPAFMILTVGMAFGWAKPVPVDPRRFVNPLKDMALVAIAGPAANLLMAIVWVIVLLLVSQLQMGSFGYWLKGMAVFGVQINAILMILNLLPVPPLDGGRILTGVLPQNMAILMIRFEKLGMLLVILLLVSGILGTILNPLVKGFQLKLYSIFGLL